MPFFYKMCNTSLLNEMCIMLSALIPDLSMYHFLRFLTNLYTIRFQITKILRLMLLNAVGYTVVSRKWWVVQKWPA
ncbi:hypothetical protein SAMN05421823_109105 [Catalinimonas alkaloidigena]|uniref:Uncharacterized protein n=1 Tax=Catalinimonas alkaloidigena TaxID=1075417 RepID=A0A1G9P7F9_9BACT|nr:hypothetical protein SAMN05421823_109105 [Catalinimonas alkaloidigena]